MHFGNYSKNSINQKIFDLLGLGFLYFNLLCAQDPLSIQAKEMTLEYENQRLVESSKRLQALYELKKDENWHDITEEVLANPETTEESKQSIYNYQRRIFIFKYLSDGLWIKGFISFTPCLEYNPLLILYRWGNENFALMNPGVVFATYKNYTVVSSMLRGGVSEGKDEFGGADVNDVKNLMNFLPQLAQELGINLHPSCVFMLGPSRGGLQMFLTLAHFPELQKRINKVVALSAILDLHQLIQDRPKDMKRMLEHQFGLPTDSRKNDWIAKRNPMNTIPYLKRSLPILIIQGTADNRINLAEGYHMAQALQRNSHQVDYWEVANGDHVLMNTPYIMNDIAHWLENNSSCMSIHLPRKKE